MKRTGWLCLLLGLVWVPTTRLAISAPASPGLARSELTPTATAVDANPITLILDPTAEFGGRVVISEIMYHPISERVSDEYLELRNLTSQPINLTGWRLSKGVDFTFPAVTLPADGYWVVAANASAFATNFPEVTNVIGQA